MADALAAGVRAEPCAAPRRAHILSEHAPLGGRAVFVSDAVRRWHAGSDAVSTARATLGRARIAHGALRARQGAGFAFLEAGARRLLADEFGGAPALPAVRRFAGRGGRRRRRRCRRGRAGRIAACAERVVDHRLPSARGHERRGDRHASLAHAVMVGECVRFDKMRSRNVSGPDVLRTRSRPAGP